MTKTSQEWKEEGTFPGEPIFVPHPQASQEDQGVLLSVVLAGQFLVMLCLVLCLAVLFVVASHMQSNQTRPGSALVLLSGQIMVKRKHWNTFSHIVQYPDSAHTAGHAIA